MSPVNIPEYKRTNKCPDRFEDNEAGLTDQPQQEGIALTPEAKFNDEVGYHAIGDIE